MLSFSLPPAPGRHAFRALILLALPLMAGCSGGGGQTAAPGVGTIASSPAAPPAINYNTAEYKQNWALGAVSAISAYQAGFTGKGIKVAVIDTGIDVNNPEFSGKIDPASTNVVSNSTANLQDTDGHGTAVAGVIGALRNGTATMGVAFDATLLAINATDTPACGTKCDFFQSDIANGMDYGRLHGAKIVNLSMGGVAVGVELEAAMRRAVAAGMIIVIAAGNEQAANPSDFAQVANASWANGQIMIAGATDQFNQLAWFSNKAGDLSKYNYLVAPGENIQTVQLGGGIHTGSGTSFSAPLVAGATAILLQEFPNLTAQQVANILLTTATDLGTPGVDNVFGYGLLNLARATAPIGTASIPTGGGPSTPLSGSGGTLSTSALHLSGAFGDALAASPALTRAMILDSYQRSFRMDLTSRISHDTTLPDLFALAEPGQKSITRDFHPSKDTSLQLTADERTAFAEVDARYFANTGPERSRLPDLRWRLTRKFSENLTFEAGSHVALTGGLALGAANLFLTRPENQNIATGKADDLSMALTSRLGRGTAITLTAGHSRSHDTYYQLDARQSTAAARVTHLLGRRLELALDLGVVSETGSVLGAMSSGAMALGDGAATRYMGLGMNWHPTASLELFGGWMSGRTKVAPAANSLFRDVSTLHSQSFRTGLTASGLLNKADRFGFMLSEPLRVTRGEAQLWLATARDYKNNRLSFEALDTRLAPSGRELDLETSYQLPLSDSLWMQAMLLHQLHAGHVADGASQTLGLLRLTTVF